MRVLARISAKDWAEKAGYGAREELIRSAVMQAAAKHRLASYRTVKRHGLLMEHDDETDGWTILIEGEPTPDISSEHREEWCPR